MNISPSGCRRGFSLLTKEAGNLQLIVQKIQTMKKHITLLLIGLFISSSCFALSGGEWSADSQPLKHSEAVFGIAMLCLGALFLAYYMRACWDDLIVVVPLAFFEFIFAVFLWYVSIQEGNASPLMSFVATFSIGYYLGKKEANKPIIPQKKKTPTLRHEGVF